MLPVRQGDRGPAVEDIQRRLLMLGYDLGPTGVDGVFLGRTAEAVAVFQEAGGLAEDGVVGERTWSALVDATFTLGDRMLYLRHPYFHGRDVQNLQGALNVLGFACGRPDGIFGPYTERAVREFQANCGQAPDGIVGPETVAAVRGLRHVWEGKDPTAPAALPVGEARRAEVLRGNEVAVVAAGPLAEVAERLANLARAAEECSDLRVSGGGVSGAERLVLLLRAPGDAAGHDARPVVTAEGTSPEALAARMLTALSSSGRGRAEVLVEVPPEVVEGEREAQRFAVALLDAVCAALA